MNFIAQINIMPLKELLDPQGKTILKNLPTIGITSINDVRMGKRIEINIEANNLNEAREIATLACENLLVNPIMENYTMEILKS